MKKKLIAFIILALVAIFPFRWAFLDYPENIKVNNTMIDGGRVQYVIYFVLVIAGLLTFMLLTMTNGKGHTENNHP